MNASEGILKLWRWFGELYKIYIVPILGIGCVYSLYIINQKRLFENLKIMLCFLGKHTIEIYSMQGYFWTLIQTNNKWINSFCTFIIAIILPLIIGHFLLKN